MPNQNTVVMSVDMHLGNISVTIRKTDSTTYLMQGTAILVRISHATGKTEIDYHELKRSAVQPAICTFLGESLAAVEHLVSRKLYTLAKLN